MSTGVAYAVVRTEPPQVFLADDVEVLQRVLAVDLVARTDPAALVPEDLATIRSALLEERWADAVVAWMSLIGVEVDVYTYLHIYSEQELPPDMIGAQLQFAPLFREPSIADNESPGSDAE
ncbi:MAG: hypothetical protein ACKVHU_20215 [Acidimicrobiales bacterium]|jgi:hypothetical protein